MLVIHSQQRRVFQQMARENFRRRAVLVLRERHDARLKNASDEEVLSLVDQGIAEAQELGVHRESDLRTYLDCFVDLGPNFTASSDHPEIFELFQDKRFDIHERMYYLARLRAVEPA